MNAQSLLFLKRYICSGIRHFRYLPCLVHQTMLAFHVVGLLLVEFPELLTYQVGLARIVDMDVHPYPLMPTGDDQ